MNDKDVVFDHGGFLEIRGSGSLWFIPKPVAIEIANTPIKPSTLMGIPVRFTGKPDAVKKKKKRVIL